MLTLSDIKKNPQVLEFIKQTEISLNALSYTEHGLRHAELVTARAREIANRIGLEKREVELAEIAGFVHDMGNFLSRTYHNYLASLLFHQIFMDDFPPAEIAIIMQAIANHDKEEMKFTSAISAVVVLADKSDVHYSRVTDDGDDDIHDRVNRATELSRLKIDKNKKRIILNLQINTSSVSVMEYFEIFTERMVYCRKAAEFLGYDFGLVINNFKLL
ncbi:MAG: HD domain-containing protein [bacterium]